MFLDVLRRRNPALIEAAMALHQAGELPANCYVIDLDAVAANARGMKAEGERFYRGHEGGFPAEEVLAVADALDSLENARFAGLTTFPAMLFDPDTRTVRPTPNLGTLERAAKALAAAGHSDLAINAPGSTSVNSFATLAAAGATQVEPGHGLTGTTPPHALEDLAEIPAVLYLTEISHLHAGSAYAFGGGLYIDPVFPDYRVRALVSPTPTTDAAALLEVDMPAPVAIDYYAILDPAGSTVSPGDSVVFGFRIQAFVTRAYVAGLRGVSRGEPAVAGVYTADGSPAAWPE